MKCKLPRWMKQVDYIPSRRIYLIKFYDGKEDTMPEEVFERLYYGT
jgi:hypothetical protein